MSNKKTKLENDFEAIMDGYQGNTPLIQQEWVKRGDYYEQYSVYDDSLVTISGIYPIQEIPVVELSSREKKATEKIHLATSESEIIGIISDELVHSLMEQLSF